MERQEMIDFLKARGMFERGMNQLVNWQLMELVEPAMDAGVPTLEEIKELEDMEKPKEEPKEEKPKAKPKATPKAKAKPKAKKEKKE